MESSHPAVVEYLAARKLAQAEYDRLKDTDPATAGAAFAAIEQPAWDAFIEIKREQDG
jgi:hypothetical protein